MAPISATSYVPVGINPDSDAQQSVRRIATGKSPGPSDDAPRDSTAVAFSATARTEPLPLDESSAANLSGVNVPKPKPSNTPQDKGLVERAVDEIGTAVEAISNAAGDFFASEESKASTANLPQPRKKAATDDVEEAGFSLSGLFASAADIVAGPLNELKSRAVGIGVALLAGVIVGLVVNKLSD